MTDDSQELDKIFNIMLMTGGQRYNYSTRQLREAKQAILDWHNKQVEEVLIGFAKEADTEYYRSEIDEWLFSLGLIVHKAIIEAERNKLKEEYNGKKEDEGSPGRAG